MKKEYEKGLRLFGPIGIPGLNIDPIDPMIFKNITVPEIDGVVVTIKECAIEGLSKCEFDRIRYVTNYYYYFFNYFFLTERQAVNPKTCKKSKQVILLVISHKQNSILYCFGCGP